MKRIASSILALVLCCAMLSGCAGKDQANTSSVPKETTEPSVEQHTPEASTAIQGGTPAPEESLEEVEASPVIEYPLTDEPMTLVLWNPLPNWLSAMFGASSWSELPVIDFVEEATGIHLEFIEPSDTAASESFNLMIASEDYPDLLDCTTYSGGGLAAAADNNVIIELTEYLDVDMPNYSTLLDSVDSASVKDTISDNGNTYAIYTIMNTYFSESGLYLRRDWLDHLNLDVPETVDQLHSYLSAIQSEYGTEYSLWADNSCVLTHIVGAFGIAGANLSAGNEIGEFIEGGKVRDSLTNNGYREYIKFMNELYEEGIIHQDFLTTNMRCNDMAASSGTGCFQAMAGQFAQLSASAVDPDFSLIGVAPIVKNSGETYRFGDIACLTNASNGRHISVSTTCLDAHLALQYLDWFFSEDAKILCNYGIEGISFNYDESGKPVYTDLVYNNNTKSYYGFQILPCYDIHDSFAYLYPDAAREAISVWTEAADSSCTCPTLSYTVEEAETYSRLSTEIGTYAAEELEKFITGAQPLNDDTWSNYVENVESMGLADVLEIMQAAYERYENR